MTNDITCPYKNLYTNVHSSTTQNNQNIKTTKMSIKSWVNTQNVVCPCSMLLAIKRNEVLLHAITCLNLGSIMLSERHKSHILASGHRKDVQHH